MKPWLKWTLLIGGGVAAIAIPVGISIYRNKREAGVARRCAGFTGAQLENCRAMFKDKSLYEINNTPYVGTKKPGAK